MSTKKHAHFVPLWGFSGPLAQTIGGFYWPRPADVRPTSNHRLALRDGDRLMLHESRPHSWQAGDPMVLLIHGMAGSWQSSYMIRLCRRFWERGVLVVRMNQRGSGPGFGLARKPGHCGRSDDVRQVVAWMEKRHPASPQGIIGISMGGNLSLKMCGEAGNNAPEHWRALVAVSPPIDIQATVSYLRRSLFRHLNWYFTFRLYNDLRKLSQLYPEIIVPKLQRWTLEEFDRRYTVPQCGFVSTADYYRSASSKSVLTQITVPTLILMALDDPIVYPEDFREVAVSPSTEVILTEKGGHVGFLGQNHRGSSSGERQRWMDTLIVEWVLKRLWRDGARGQT